MIDLTIKGLQEAQRANVQAIEALKPRGSFGRAIQTGTAAIHRFAVYHTPWDTRSLATSHRMEIRRRGLEGRVFLDPRAANPRTGQRPSEYGYHLHQQGRRPGRRGGVRAFYEHTVDTHSRSTLEQMGHIIIRGLPR